MFRTASNQILAPIYARIGRRSRTVPVLGQLRDKFCLNFSQSRSARLYWNVEGPYKECTVLANERNKEYAKDLGDLSCLTLRYCNVRESVIVFRGCQAQINKDVHCRLFSYSWSNGTVDDNIDYIFQTAPKARYYGIHCVYVGLLSSLNQL